MNYDHLWQFNNYFVKKRMITLLSLMLSSTLLFIPSSLAST